MRIKSLLSGIKRVSLPTLCYSLLGVGIMALLLFRLKTLLPGVNMHEWSVLDQNQGFKDVLHSPLNAPHTLVYMVLKYVIRDSVTALRATSVLFGFAMAVVLFLTTKTWFTTRVAALSIFLFATSSWFLGIARSGTPTILLAIAPLALMLMFHSLETTSRKGVLIMDYFLFMLTVAASLYVPYMIWFVLLMSVLHFKTLTRLATKLPWGVQIGGTVLLLVLLVPLGWAFAKDPVQATAWMGIPTLWPSFKEILLGSVHSLSGLFIRIPMDSNFHLGTLPLLDVGTSIVFALGVYYTINHIKERYIQLALFSILPTIFLCGLNPEFQTTTLLMPFVYIITSFGIVTLLRQWFTVFPRNNVARVIGVASLSVVIAIIGTYHVVRYYIAWPQTPGVRAAHRIQR